MDRTGGPRRIGDLLAPILRAANPRKRGGFAELSEAWARAVGPDVARQSRIAGFQKDVVTVSVESPALRQELETFRRDEILERLRAEFPAKRIAALKCVVRGH